MTIGHLIIKRRCNKALKHLRKSTKLLGHVMGDVFWYDEKYFVEVIEIIRKAADEINVSLSNGIGIEGIGDE